MSQKKNLKLIIEYDGTNFLGWQVQKSGRTVQGEIEFALRKIFNTNKISLIASGRTDSGVHAKAQHANIKLTTDMDTKQIQKAINGNIGKDVYVKICEFVNENFHARFNAKIREYRYFITDKYSPLNRNKEWCYLYDLDKELLKKCSDLIIGEHNFSRFCKASSDVKSKICHIYESEWNFNHGSGNYVIKANRYLQHMVRYLVGTMLEVSRGRYSITQFKSLLNDKNDDIMVFRAPANGLFLWNVIYD